MPRAAPRHCPRPGHAPFTGARGCPVCRAERDATRPTSRQRGYTGKWQIARKAFLSTNPVCVTCDAPATVVDHATPHRGDARLFWARSNWRPMCASCHSRKTVLFDGGFGR